MKRPLIPQELINAMVSATDYCPNCHRPMLSAFVPGNSPKVVSVCSNQQCETASGGIWPVEPAPNGEFIDGWRCFEVKQALRQARTWHLAGCVDNSGRVCSAIVSIDPASRSVTTESGSVYKLGRRTGINLDAEYVWNNWLRLAVATDTVDVTDALLREIRDK